MLHCITVVVRNRGHSKVVQRNRLRLYGQVLRKI